MGGFDTVFLNQTFDPLAERRNEGKPKKHSQNGKLGLAMMTPAVPFWVGLLNGAKTILVDSVLNSP